VLQWHGSQEAGIALITPFTSIRAFPVVGNPLVTWLWGGLSVENATLNRFWEFIAHRRFLLHLGPDSHAMGHSILAIPGHHRFSHQRPCGLGHLTFWIGWAWNALLLWSELVHAIGAYIEATHKLFLGQHRASAHRDHPHHPRPRPGLRGLYGYAVPNSPHSLAQLSLPLPAGIAGAGLLTKLRHTPQAGWATHRHRLGAQGLLVYWVISSTMGR
jgi:hypothetical protein